MSRQQRIAKQSVVVGVIPEDYRVPDPRFSRPLCMQKKENGELAGSMLLQALDSVSVAGRRISYFVPNSIAILLAVANKAIAQAQDILRGRFTDPDVVVDFREHRADRKDFLNEKTCDVCDYIEVVETAIVFAYTALETFANLSIPDDYVYEVEMPNKGTKEVFDKNAIERWVSLKEKLLKILRDVYKTRRPDRQDWWSHFVKLEAYRHDIIHQKSVSTSAFFKAYFTRDIFQVCQSAEKAISFFYHEHAEQQRTNPLWPWLTNAQNYIPVSETYESKDVEVVGNLYEGIPEPTKRKR